MTLLHPSVAFASLTWRALQAALLAILQTPDRAARVGNLVLYPGKGDLKPAVFLTLPCCHAGSSPHLCSLDLREWKLPGIAFRKHRADHACSGNTILVHVRLLSPADLKDG